MIRAAHDMGLYTAEEHAKGELLLKAAAPDIEREQLYFPVTDSLELGWAGVTESESQVLADCYRFLHIYDTMVRHCGLCRREFTVPLLYPPSTVTWIVASLILSLFKDRRDALEKKQPWAPLRYTVHYFFPARTREWHKDFWALEGKLACGARKAVHEAQQRVLALAEGLHPRLGAGSPLRLLDHHILRTYLAEPCRGSWLSL